MLRNCENLDVEIEQQVLGAMMIRDGEKIPVILAILTAEDFSRVEHKILYKRIAKIYLSGIKPDMLALIAELKRTGEFGTVGVDYIAELPMWTYTNAYIEQHARILKEKSERRRLREIGSKLYAAAQIGQTSISDIIDSVQRELQELTADETSRITGYKNYLYRNFKSEVELTKKYSQRKTGFENIDEHQIFSSGLYLIGATPATGKTTFAWQIAEQLAKKGETCIFCSYEMSRLELFSKSVARELFMRDSSTSLTAADIRRGGWTSEIDKIIEDSQFEDCDLRTIELHDETIDDLLKILRPLCVQQKKSPVVFIDYLQIIPSAKDSIKLGVDDTVRKLKIFQRETNTTFIIISSLNRANYSNSISFESFKESGNIEYTADVVWGLQLNILNQIKGGANISDIRQKIDEAKKMQPRQIQLKCLKNRQGNNYDCYFNYFSAHDYFQPCDKSEFEDIPESARTLR